MKTNKINNRIKDYYRDYMKSDWFELYEAYGKCSYTKHKIWEKLKDEYTNNWDSAGYSPKIIRAGSSYFSCGYIGTNKETGQLQFIVDVPSNQFVVDITDELYC